MSRAREWILLAAVALIAGGTGYAYHVWRSGAEAHTRAPDLTRLMRAQLPDLESRLQSMEQWRGQVLVINFWATWCAPCREEIPLFVKLQQAYRDRGVTFVGIAIDGAEKVRPYAAELKMNFPVLIGGAEAIELARAAGNTRGALPYTLVIDRTGKLAAAEVGIVKEHRLTALLLSLL